MCLHHLCCKAYLSCHTACCFALQGVVMCTVGQHVSGLSERMRTNTPASNAETDSFRMSNLPWNLTKALIYSPSPHSSLRSSAALLFLVLAAGTSASCSLKISSITPSSRCSMTACLRSSSALNCVGVNMMLHHPAGNVRVSSRPLMAVAEAYTLSSRPMCCTSSC